MIIAYLFNVNIPNEELLRGAISDHRLTAAFDVILKPLDMIKAVSYRIVSRNDV